jgi:hypothetical protein
MDRNKRRALVNAVMNLDKPQRKQDSESEIMMCDRMQMYITIVYRFQATTVKEVIHGVMNDELGGKKYTVEEAEVWTKNIATSVRNKVKGKR